MNKRNIILCIIAGGVIAFFIWLLSHYRQELNEKNIELDYIKSEFEVDAINSCRQLTKEVMLKKQELQLLQDQKNSLCDTIENKPKDIIDPYSYYDVYGNKKKDNSEAQSSTRQLIEE